MATMVLGLTKKLQPLEVRHYKETWEARCATDIKSLSRDRLSFYATLYKNVPRIREAFLSLKESERRQAARLLCEDIASEEEAKNKDAGYQWQVTPHTDRRTLACLQSAMNGELWPEWLPRVGGHPADPDYPIDMSPPNGLPVFHHYDLYCQVLVGVLLAARGCVPLEEVAALRTVDQMDTFSGSLVSFRNRAYGKGLSVIRNAPPTSLSYVQFRKRRGDRIFRTLMTIKDMYVFSDTAFINLRSSRICGIGMFGGATQEIVKGKKEVHIRVTPLIIGMGGLNRSDASGWWWNDAAD